MRRDSCVLLTTCWKRNSVASTWIGPDTALSPQFLSILPNASSESQPRLPSSISLFTASNYTPSLSSDDCSNICLSIVMQLGAAATDKFMGEERQAMVLKPGCEACGQLKASSVMKKCESCSSSPFFFLSFYCP